MTTGENVQELKDGGYTQQALQMAENMSISVEELENGGTRFIFGDGSTVSFFGLDPK